MVIILREILKTKSARKIFGKRELEIIFSQLDGLALTQSEKNRLSRDIKPKFEFISLISPFAHEFKLEKNQHNKSIIEKTVRVILGDQNKDMIESILLFGSFANNTFTNRSDIDLCVVFKKSLSRRDAMAFRIRIAGQVSKKNDVQVFDALPQKIKREIARCHRVLFRSKGYDNISFSIHHMKDDGYFQRMEKVFGAKA